MICPVCEYNFQGGFDELSKHMESRAEMSDPYHVMWLNRNISKEELNEEDLSLKLSEFYDFSRSGLAGWIKKRFVEKFFSSQPHPFILEMQDPSKYTIMGYVTEHYHFLKQWVKSCAYIIAQSDAEDVQRYEIENISEEYFGLGDKIPHVELLLRMGESVGLPRGRVISSSPLPETKKAVDFWNRVCRDKHWLLGMTSMHSLELIADRNVKDYGASYTYFDPRILDGSLTKEVEQFLRAGYDADVYHSAGALSLIEKYSRELKMERDVQSYFILSSEMFYRYLNSRLERGRMYEKEL
ncbi:MAG: C2H2 type zinc finger domain-containing protein [Thermoplasmatales archaeon]